MKYTIFLITQCILFPLQATSHIHNLIAISQQDILNNDVVYEQKLMQGMHDGLFYIEIPDQCLKYMPYAYNFTNTFYYDETLKNQQFTGFSGYNDRTHAQIESFYLEQTFWKKIFSEEMQQFATCIKLLGENILKKIIYLTIPQTILPNLNKITGKVLDHKGQYHFICNHYRSEKNAIGLPAHQDFGFITLLYINKPGLVAYVNGMWGMVLPKENHFIINLGRALETLINNTTILTAALHAVEPIKDQDGRISFGLSIEGNLQSPVYQISHDQSLKKIHHDFQSYIQDCFNKTYDI